VSISGTCVLARDNVLCSWARQHPGVKSKDVGSGGQGLIRFIFTFMQEKPE